MACFSPRMRKAPLSTVGEFSALKRIWPKVVVFAPPSPLGVARRISHHAYRNGREAIGTWAKAAVGNRARRPVVEPDSALVR
jgi:hypothetical protein